MHTHEDLNTLAYTQIFNGGAFLMAGKEERNPMTIGWCQFGRLWNIPVLTIYVRPSRYSHGLIERDGVFTISFPMGDSTKQALSFCGRKSGREINKLEALGIATIPNRAGGVDPMQGNFIHYECKVIGKAEFQEGLTFLQTDLKNRFYSLGGEAATEGDLHTVYYAEILDAYHVG